MAEKSFERKLKELKKIAGEEHMHLFDDLTKIEEKISPGGAAAKAWEKVSLARKPERPSALDYVDEIFDRFLELKGDRKYGDDPALIGGIATLEGMPLTIIGNQKGRNLKANIHRNYGMAHPEGYRKALRLAKEAEIFGRPVLAFIDTPGAYPGVAAEERGIGQAIAENLKEFSTLQVPVVSIVIGEGGSGGALGIGVGDETYMMENSIYSVISPEGCASILLRDVSKAKLAADLLKLTAEDLRAFGVIDGVIPEPGGGADVDFSSAASAVKAQIASSLAHLSNKKRRALLRDRSNRILSFGPFYEEVEKRKSIFSRIFKTG